VRTTFRPTSLEKEDFEKEAPRLPLALETGENASQNSFLIPTSQNVAEPRVSSGAEIKNSDEASSARISGFWRECSYATHTDRLGLCGQPFEICEFMFLRI
jgi:hypothetical protein